LIHQAWPSPPKNLSYSIYFLGFYVKVKHALECVLSCPGEDKQGDFKRRRLRLRSIQPDITNELGCLGTCNVSMPSGVLITHTKPLHQSNWILERKLNMSKAINSAVALFVCLGIIIVE